MSRKKKLKEKDFLEILKTNSKENPFNIDEYDKQSIVDCKISTKTVRTPLYICFHCIECNCLTSKTIRDKYHNDIKTISLCKKCKSITTNIEKYGVPNPQQNKDIHNKTKKTNLKKYGVENPYQIDYVSDKRTKSIRNNIEIINEKTRKTNLERYGVEYPFQSDEIKQKSMDTCIKKYGVPNVGLNKAIIKKREKTNIKRYGVKNAFQSEEIKNKIRQTNMERYGVEYAGQSVESQEIAKQTKLDRYGTLHFENKYQYKSLFFDSSWELAFYIYHIDKCHKIKHEPCNFSYTYNKQDHYYFPDFKVNNKYYEIKGEQFIERYKNGKIKTLVCPFDNSLNGIYNAKYKCMKKHNVTIIDGYKIQKYLEYVINKYGEDYLDQFRIE